MNTVLPANLKHAADAMDDLVESMGIDYTDLARARAAAADNRELADRAIRVFGVQTYGDLSPDLQHYIETCSAALAVTSDLYDECHGQGSAITNIETRWARVWAWRAL